MITDSQTARVRGFVPKVLPWVLGAAMLAIFLVTMSRWVNPSNLGEVVDLANWDMGAHQFGPVTYLVTYPLRWLPQQWIPLAFNLFSAISGALALALLARSVALLPHDRTHEEREREESEFAILTNRTAWLPPLFAVLVCGLQLTFWSYAATGTSELFNLLLFAYVIRCLLEYRINCRESWLARFALVYGLGMANNWAMVGFFPAFLAAVIWIKGLGAFSPRFIVRTFSLGIAGFLLVFLLPLVNHFTHATDVTFWGMVRATFSFEKNLFTGFPRDTVAILGLTSLLPVLVMGIRWPSYFGDNSPIGIFMATWMFHIVAAAFLGACLWVTLDSPISPRMIGFGFPFLTFYYLGALGVGYLSGYFLLVFGPTRSRRVAHPLLQTVNITVTVAIFALTVAMPALLVRKNLPHLLSAKDAARMYENYFSQVEDLLPKQGAVVLSDDEFRLDYLRAMLSRQPGHSPHLLVNTAKLEKEPAYLKYLEQSNPGYTLCGPWTNIPPTAVPALSKIQLLEHLAATHPIYYLHPSFGYYFERFYPEPHGVVYQLKPYPADDWNPPALTPALIAENQNFWKHSFEQVLPPLIAYVDKPYHPPANSLWKTLLEKLHLKPEADLVAMPLGGYYARCLDEWGVRLQMAGKLPEAAKAFEQTLELSTNNASARINLAFNANLAAGRKSSISPSKEVASLMERFSDSWSDMLRSDGPIDEPSFRSELAVQLANGWNYRQAYQELRRVRELVPNDLRIPLQTAHMLTRIQDQTNGLSMLLPYTNCYAMALTNLDLVLKYIPDSPLVLSMQGYNLMQLKSYERAINPLTRILALTNVPPAQANGAQLNRAIAYYKVGNLNAARSDYESVTHAYPKAFQAYYGLGEIAYQQKDKAGAIHNYHLYLTNAPRQDSPEAQTVSQRLKELESGAH